MKENVPYEVENENAICPLCCTTGCVMDGPENSDIPTECRHYLCTSCWEILYDRNDAKCPYCRRCVCAWLYSHYPLPSYSEDESSEQD